LQTSVDKLKGLPPALVITNEHDVLRYEGKAYADKLTQAGVGVPVTATCYLDTINDFMMLNPISDTPAVRRAVDQASEMLKKKLSTVQYPIIEFRNIS
jgi:acetyl esterase